MNNTKMNNVNKDPYRRKRGKHWHSRIRLKRISKIAIYLCFAFSLILAGFTFYGNKIGNFVISLGDSDKSLALSYHNDPKDSKYYKSVLNMPGLRKQRDMTFYERVPLDIDKGMGRNGVKNDTKTQNYVAFSFYLINTSKTDVDYEMDVVMVHQRNAVVSYQVLDAARIMIIEGDVPEGTWSKAVDNSSSIGGESVRGKGTGQPGKIYKSEEKDDLDIDDEEEMQKEVEERKGKHTKEEKEEYLNNYNYKTEKFHPDSERKSTESLLINKRYENFAKNAFIKYTYVMWLEGFDYDCNDNVLGSSLKMRIGFNIVDKNTKK